MLTLFAPWSLCHCATIKASGPLGAKRYETDERKYLPL